jgi:hypothetical protein
MLSKIAPAKKWPPLDALTRAFYSDVSRQRMLELSQRVKSVVERVFSTNEIELAKTLLIHDCGNNVPQCEEHTPEKMDRIRLAAIKSSNGVYAKLVEAVSLANTDWRDLLMAAGFGYDIDAHNKWVP